MEEANKVELLRVASETAARTGDPSLSKVLKVYRKLLAEIEEN